jgi:hypothetical protein
MTRRGVLPLVLAVLLGAPAAAPRAAQTDRVVLESPGYNNWFFNEHNVDVYRAMDPAKVETEAAYIRGEILKYANNTDKVSRGYVNGLRWMYQNMRDALGERGMHILKVPDHPGAETAAALAGGSAPKGTTLATPKASAGGDAVGPRPVLAVPLLVVLTTAQIAECTARGKALSDCASEVAVTAAAGALGGTVITVLAPGATPVLTVVAVGAGTAQTLVNLGRLGLETVRGAGAVLGERDADAQLRTAQQANLNAMTPDRMATIVAAFARELREVDRRNADAEPLTAGVSAASAALAAIVNEARSGVRTVARLNETVALAASQCGNPEKNPVRFVVDVEGRIKTTHALADRIVEGTRRAAAMAACPTAAEAQRLLTDARRDKSELDHTVLDAQQDLIDAATFFKVVKAGRSAAADATKRLADLDRTIADARLAAKTLQDRVTVYRTARTGAIRDTERLATEARALHAAFPDPPPDFIASALQQIDAMQPAATTSFDDDELRRYARDTDTDVNRVEGLVRQARGRMNSLAPCESITDELPDPLRREMMQLGADIANDASRAEAAFKAVGDIPAKLSLCATTAPNGGDGTLSGRCTGTIAADPEAGKPGTPLHLTVQITGAAAPTVSRVVVDNPGCTDARCRDTRALGGGRFEIWLGYQAPATARAVDGVIATFQVKFQAFAGEALECAGQSKPLRVLAR